jgi:hypothetical protein
MVDGFAVGLKALKSPIDAHPTVIICRGQYSLALNSGYAVSVRATDRAARLEQPVTSSRASS